MLMNCLVLSCTSVIGGSTRVAQPIHWNSSSADAVAHPSTTLYGWLCTAHLVVLQHAHDLLEARHVVRVAPHERFHLDRALRPLATAPALCGALQLLQVCLRTDQSHALRIIWWLG